MFSFAGDIAVAVGVGRGEGSEGGLAGGVGDEGLVGVVVVVDHDAYHALALEGVALQGDGG